METRNYQLGAAASPPSAPAVPSNGYPTNGNPSAGTPATEPGEHWFYKVGEELRALIVGSGLTPSDTDLAQIAKSVQSGGVLVATAGGSADALTATFTPAITAIANQTVFIRAASANATATPTLAVNGLAAITLVKGNNLPLVAGDIAGISHWLEIKLDATLGRGVLLNPATGVSTVTATNDATFADNSNKQASTSWVRGAMSAIATSAGFAVSLSTNGYIKLPSWLGGLILQWGQTVIGWGALGTIPFNINFPNSCLAGYTIVNNATAGYACSTGALSTSSMGAYHNASSNQNISWLAVGK